jgi:hypothetical protein
MCSKVVLKEHTGFYYYSFNLLRILGDCADTQIIYYDQGGQERRTSVQRYTRIGTHDRITGTDSDESELGR